MKERFAMPEFLTRLAFAFLARRYNLLPRRIAIRHFPGTVSVQSYDFFFIFKGFPLFFFIFKWLSIIIFLFSNGFPLFFLFSKGFPLFFIFKGLFRYFLFSKSFPLLFYFRMIFCYFFVFEGFPLLSYVRKIFRYFFILKGFSVFFFNFQTVFRFNTVNRDGNRCHFILKMETRNKGLPIPGIDVTWKPAELAISFFL